MKLSKNKLKEILKKYDKKLKIVSYKRLTAGNINPMYELVTDKRPIMLRICLKRWEHYKIDKEVFIYSLIKEKTKLPVPNILIVTI